MLPLHHVHGIINALHCAHAAGAAVEFLPKFSPGEVWKCLMVRLQSTSAWLAELLHLSGHSLVYQDTYLQKMEIVVVIACTFTHPTFIQSSSKREVSRQFSETL